MNPLVPRHRQQPPRLAPVIFRVGGLALLLAGLLHLVAPSATTAPQPPPPAHRPAEGAPPPIDPEVAEELARTGQATFFALLDEQSDLAPAYTIRDWTARGRFVLEALQRTAARSQAPLLALLRQRQADPAGGVTRVQPFFIVNAVLVTARADAVTAIQNTPGVVRLQAHRVLSLPPVEPAPLAAEWGLSKIGADAVWAQLGVRGNGIVVASIDTGVQYNHPALYRQYRGRQADGSYDHNYNWWDPAHICGSAGSAPCDNNGHGTHTMGTMVGDDGGSNQVGVAPEARWIAAKGCESNQCSAASLLSSGQWILAPTNAAGQNPDPSKRPHVVNNSWGSSGGDTFYEQTVNAWHAAGIFPAFAAGNSGSSCNTAGSPGDYRLSFASGASNSSDGIASFSSRGPAYWGGIKPDVAAPGVSVRSSYPTNSYANLSGTSMASPHSAGLVALIWSAGPQLIGRITDTVSLLKSTATGIADSQCPPGGAGPPNNVYGSGRISATAAVSQASTAGFVSGTVLAAATGAPVTGTAVSLSGNGYFPGATSDASGRFTLTAGAGTYTTTTSPPYGLVDAPTQVMVSTGLTTSVVLSLPEAPAFTVAGYVREADSALPLSASVRLVGTPVSTVTADSSGFYSLSVLQGSYVAQVGSVPGHRDIQETITVTDHLSRNFILAPGGAFGCSDCPIPVNDYTTITSVITVGVPLTVSDFTLDIDLRHTAIVDLVIRLLSPRGISVTLHNRTGGFTDDRRGNYDINLPVDGPGHLDDFNGEHAEGPWRLVVADQDVNDTGSLQSWKLHITGTIPPLAPTTTLRQQASPPIAVPGQSQTYVVTVTNPSTVTARSLAITDTLPAAVTLQSAGGATVSAATLSWASQDLLPGRSRTVTAVVLVGALGNGAALTNTVLAESSPADGVAATRVTDTLARASWRALFPFVPHQYAGGW